MAACDASRIPSPARVLVWLTVGSLASFAACHVDAPAIGWARDVEAAVEARSPAWNEALKQATQGFGRVHGGVAAGLLLVVLGRSAGAWRRRVVTLALALVISGLYVAAFKVAVGRARPGPALRATGGYETLVEGPAVALADPQYRSFPSGHTAAAATTAAVLAAYHPALGPAGLALTAVVGLERVYDAKHYPSDVVAGGLTGWLIGWYVYSARARGGLRMPWEPRCGPKRQREPGLERGVA